MTIKHISFLNITVLLFFTSVIHCQENCNDKLSLFGKTYNEVILPTIKNYKMKKEINSPPSNNIKFFIDSIYTHFNATFTSCDRTDYKFITTYVMRYLNNIYENIPQKRDQIFLEMDELLIQCKTNKKDSSFVYLSDLKAKYHLRANDYTKMKIHLEEAIDSGDQLYYGKYGKDLFRARTNLSLYYQYMDLYQESMKLCEYNDSISKLYNIPDSHQYSMNKLFLIDAVYKLEQYEYFYQLVDNLESYLTNVGLLNEYKNDIEELRYIFYLDQNNFDRADSIYVNYLEKTIDPDYYDLKLKRVKLLIMKGNYSKAQEILDEIQQRFDIRSIPKVHKYRIMLCEYRLDLAERTKNDSMINRTLDELVFSFNANINNIYNEDPASQLKILTSMQSFAWDIVKKYGGTLDERRQKQLFDLNTNLKSLSPSFFAKRNEILNSSNNTMIRFGRNRILNISDNLAMNFKMLSINETNILMDSIKYFEKLIHSELISDLVFDIPSLDVEEIQHCLKNDEVYIEFLDISGIKMQDDKLFAFVINNKSFKMIEYNNLINIDQKVKSYKTDKMANFKLYQNLIKPIINKFEEVKYLYIVSDGKINDTAIEILSPDGSKSNMLLEKYHVQYFSNGSTFIENKRHLRSKSHHSPDIALVGGLDFVCPKDRNEVMPVSLRSGHLNYLTGSLKEVKLIDTICKINKYNSDIYSECNGSKPVLISILKNKNKNHLHISTHGVQIKEKSNTDRSNLFLMSNHKSFLALAGGEDGLISAYEIINMDLKHLDLVFLSACSTGIGDYFNGQGMFSVGQAFKSAGAKKVIYTLWDIPDDVTVKFVAEFYSEYFKSFDASLALDSAKSKLRRKYPPSYWAAFRILN
jgi:CHAT domain-containing protein